MENNNQSKNRRQEKKREYDDKNLPEHVAGKKRERKKRWGVIFCCVFALVIIAAALFFAVFSFYPGKESTTSTLLLRAQDFAGRDRVKTADETVDSSAEDSVFTEAREKVGSDAWLRTDLDGDVPMVALTFDDGPYTPVTQSILDTLEEYGAKATFFCVGNRIADYSEVVTNAYQMGCQIAGHTYEHKELTTLSKKEIKAQQDDTDQALLSLIGCKTTALRPPEGAIDDNVLRTVTVPLVCWDVDTKDWELKDTDKILARCETIADGDIVLFHDLYPTTAEAIETLVPRLCQEGFLLVTVDELFYYRGTDAQAGNVYYSAG